jgi:hypothetical protein
VILTARMAWTQADAEKVREAIVALASGTRVVTISYAGPPARSVAYGIVDLPSLRSLLAEMDRQVGGAPRFGRFAFKKGFDPNA